jgi:hypothetical protein
LSFGFGDENGGAVKNGNNEFDGPSRQHRDQRLLRIQRDEIALWDNHGLEELRNSKKKRKKKKEKKVRQKDSTDEKKASG